MNASTLEWMNIQLSNSVEFKNLKWGDKTIDDGVPDRSLSNLKNISQPLIVLLGQSALMNDNIEVDTLKGNQTSMTILEELLGLGQKDTCEFVKENRYNDW